MWVASQEQQLTLAFRELPPIFEKSVIPNRYDPRIAPDFDQ